jgi:hypothetical protein
LLGGNPPFSQLKDRVKFGRIGVTGKSCMVPPQQLKQDFDQVFAEHSCVRHECVANLQSIYGF